TTCRSSAAGQPRTLLTTPPSTTRRPTSKTRRAARALPPTRSDPAHRPPPDPAAPGTELHSDTHAARRPQSLTGYRRFPAQLPTATREHQRPTSSGPSRPTTTRAAPETDRTPHPEPRRALDERFCHYSR